MHLLFNGDKFPFFFILYAMHHILINKISKSSLSNFKQPYFNHCNLSKLHKTINLANVNLNMKIRHQEVLFKFLKHKNIKKKNTIPKKIKKHSCILKSWLFNIVRGFFTFNAFHVFVFTNFKFIFYFFFAEINSFLCIFVQNKK